MRLPWLSLMSLKFTLCLKLYSVRNCRDVVAVGLGRICFLQTVHVIRSIQITEFVDPPEQRPAVQKPLSMCSNVLFVKVDVSTRHQSISLEFERNVHHHICPLLHRCDVSPPPNFASFVSNLPRVLLNFYF